MPCSPKPTGARQARSGGRDEYDPLRRLHPPSREGRADSREARAGWGPAAKRLPAPARRRRRPGRRRTPLGSTFGRVRPPLRGGRLARRLCDLRGPHALGDLLPSLPLDQRDVVLALEVEPELAAIAEIATEAHRRVGRD